LSKTDQKIKKTHENLVMSGIISIFAAQKCNFPLSELWLPHRKRGSPFICLHRGI